MPTYPNKEERKKDYFFSILLLQEGLKQAKAGADLIGITDFTNAIKLLKEKTK